MLVKVKTAMWVLNVVLVAKSVLMTPFHLSFMGKHGLQSCGQEPSRCGLGFSEHCFTSIAVNPLFST